MALEKLFTDPAAASARKALLVAAPTESVTAADTVRQVLRPFLSLAFRRPVSDQEVERYAKLADTALAKGDGREEKIEEKRFEAAIRKSLKPVLVSPHFLFRWQRMPNENAPTVAAFGDGVYIGSLWPGKLLRSTDGIHWKPVLELPHHILGLGYGKLGIK